MAVKFAALSVMELREIAAISGKSGLFQILKPSKSGVIVETLDGTKTRFLAPASSKVSILSEITMYTADAEGSISLHTVLTRIFEQFGETLSLNAKSDSADLVEFMAAVVPEYDRAKVYASDIKKLVVWYNIIVQNAPEVIKGQQPSEGVVEESSKEDAKEE